MKIENRTSARPTKALAYLFALTGCIAIGSTYLGVASRPAFMALVVVVAIAKVRLVAADFLGLRGRGSPIYPALIAWAMTILSMALLKTLASGTFL
ncbi:hypothetical protein AS026_00115 [Rhizobium altiplani]|uniref:Cytochrome C oxidase subunit IV n=1 Tax=Rhizobium altiplani TaxID=1864509 RepID=A0A120FRK2_9HYPH|nr:hypothetical protein [Rhizobium altiplani]KWV60246.1 hypothetical protein AS026_00115 [Rhizobium altiplani]